jgi:hypothetical protein
MPYQVQIATAPTQASTPATLVATDVDSVDCTPDNSNAFTSTNPNPAHTTGPAIRRHGTAVAPRLPTTAITTGMHPMIMLVTGAPTVCTPTTTSR